MGTLRSEVTGGPLRCSGLHEKTVEKFFPSEAFINMDYFSLPQALAKHLLCLHRHQDMHSAKECVL